MVQTRHCAAFLFPALKWRSNETIWGGAVPETKYFQRLYTALDSLSAAVGDAAARFQAQCLWRFEHDTHVRNPQALHKKLIIW
jgi:hypothetical protein